MPLSVETRHALRNSLGLQAGGQLINFLDGLEYSIEALAAPAESAPAVEPVLAAAPEPEREPEPKPDPPPPPVVQAQAPRAPVIKAVTPVVTDAAPADESAEHDAPL